MKQTFKIISNEHSPRSGKRLLWFLVIPVVLASSAFFGMQARQQQSQQLANTTKSLEVQIGQRDSSRSAASRARISPCRE